MLSSLSSYAKELKQHGAEEAARDQTSQVTAEDAERVMVEESKKGGAAAFQFDPEASPEEKAAQAAAVCIMPISSTQITADLSFLQRVPSGFHHKKPSGVGIATDIVCGYEIQSSASTFTN